MRPALAGASSAPQFRLARFKPNVSRKVIRFEMPAGPGRPSAMKELLIDPWRPGR